MKILTGNQIAAARALLGWDQKQVAERVGLTIAAISKIEKGENKGKASTLEKIQMVFELAGIEFIENEGLRKRQQQIKIFHGKEDFWSFFDDVYDVAKHHPNPDICITSVKEAEYERWLGGNGNVHQQRMINLNGKPLKVLVKDDDSYFSASRYCEYRCVREGQFADASAYIYGDKAAFIQFDKNDVVVTLVENRAVADSMRKMFEAVWITAKKVDSV